MDAGNVEEARYYASLFSDSAEKLQAFIKTELWENAANVAMEMNDLPSLQLIRTKCDDEDLKMRILQRLR